ncbi:MAG: methyl-accepting chemotaxis protein [Dehalococcoidia bacterium]
MKTDTRLTSADKDQIRTTFELLRPSAAELATRFYAELFTRHPDVRGLFTNTDLHAQQTKLIGALSFVVSNLNEPTALNKGLLELGRKHQVYGAEPAHYAAVAATLVDVMERMAGRHWSPAARESWTKALNIVATTMLSAYGTGENVMNTEALNNESSVWERISGRSERTLRAGLARLEQELAESRRELAETRRELADNRRLRQALDKVCANVMVADADYNIVYLNETVQEMFSKAEADIRSDLPKFSARGLIGTNIDVFHVNPAHQRRMLESLQTTFTSELEVGGRLFQIVANPVLDAQGARLGTVVEWQDLTEARRKEVEEQARAEQAQSEAAANARIRQALDKVTTNVMMADADLNIIYLNDTLREMLGDAQADIRRDLPNFDVSTLIGTNIDVFHKNASHQRRMLAELRTTFESELKIGGRTLRIIANPVLAPDGTRLGTVVEWADRTQELAIEEEVQHMVTSAKAGDLSARIPLNGKHGFISNLSAGINDLVAISEQVINDTIRVLGALARGDLSERIASDYEGSFGRLKSDANATVDKLTEVVTSIKGSAVTLSQSAGELSAGNANLSQRTEEQASSLEETASSMEEMTSSVSQNADSANQANQLALGARKQAEQGGQVVGNAVTAMSAINESSRKISDIIGVIDEIAFQTNLLALNASVEAARAGEQGRGFAVVASEVRNLAGRSATAAKEIKELIVDSSAKVEEGSRLVNESGSTLDEIVNAVKKVTDIVAEIAAASTEQSAGIEQVNKAVMQMDEMTQQNAALVEEAAAAAEAINHQSVRLSDMIAFFSVEAADAADGRKTPAPPLDVERRGAGRPWPSSPAPTAAADSRVKPVRAVPAPRPVGSNAAADADWEEF